MIIIVILKCRTSLMHQFSMQFDLFDDTPGVAVFQADTGRFVSRLRVARLQDRCRGKSQYASLTQLPTRVVNQPHCE